MAPATKEELLESLQRRQERSVQTLQKQQPDWFMLTPLAFAPALPLIRIAFAKQPRVRTALFSGTIGIAVLHGFALMSGAYK